jgi:hypothetical protein
VTRFDSIRKYANGIYQALRSSLKCSCQGPHQAGLGLRTESQENATQRSGHDDSNVQFKIVVKSFDLSTKIPSETFQELRILVWQSANASTHNAVPTPGSGIPAKPKRKVGFMLVEQFGALQLAPDVSQRSVATCVSSTAEETPIADLCEAIKMYSQKPSSDCLGLLVGNQAKFKVYPIVSLPTKPKTQWTSATLSQVLQGKMKHGRGLTRSDKLNLAATLASAVVTLYSTPWMESQWTKKDISFPYNSDQLSFDRAFVSKSLPTRGTQSATSASANLPPFIRNQTIFTLGILLIEICLGKPLEQLRTADDPVVADGGSSLFTDYSTANRLINSDLIFFEGGRRYDSAVRSCIYCLFDPRIRKPDLEYDDFRQAVYDDVVAPLNDEAHEFHSPI